jgi:hypothetical protein
MTTGESWRMRKKDLFVAGIEPGDSSKHGRPIGLEV